MRFAQFGDTHLGYKALRYMVDNENVRTRDTRIAFETACAQIAAQMEDLDFVIHTGDLFDHAKPNYRTISIAIKGLRQIADSGKPMIIVAGNHDISRVKTAGSVYDVMRTALPENVHIVDGFEVETLNMDVMTKYGPESVRFVCIPYGVTMTGDLSYEYRDDGAEYRILIAHGTLEGAMPEVEAMSGYDFSNIDIAPMAAPGGYAHFALGHLHTKDWVGDRTLYNGSTNRFGWSDKDATPGWWIVDADHGSWTSERQELDSREMIDLENQVIDYKALNAGPDDIHRVAETIERELSYQKDLAMQRTEDTNGVPNLELIPLFRVRVQCNRADYRKIVQMLSGMMDGRSAWNLTIERTDAADKGLPEMEKTITEGKAPLKMLLEQYREKILVDRYGNAEADRIGGKMLEYLERAEEEQE